MAERTNLKRACFYVAAALGFFEETVPAFKVPGPIALLRLDGDLYTSTKVVLDNFYEHMQNAAWVIIDDYTWKPRMATSKLCKEAVDEFRLEHSITTPMTAIYGPMSWQVVGPEIRFKVRSGKRTPSYSLCSNNNLRLLQPLQVNKPPPGTQMGDAQIAEILSALGVGGNMLVFGLGNDSPFWHDSTDGQVIFLEVDWFESHGISIRMFWLSSTLCCISLAVLQTTWCA
jgi:hypothetical protein